MHSPAQATPAVGEACVDERPVLRIGLLWHTFRSENLGVGALTIANLNLIAAAAEKAGRRPLFHLLGSQGHVDYRNETTHETDFTNVGYKALITPGSPLNRKFAQCDIVFDIGAGDSFSDIYAWKRYGLMLGSKLAAARAGAPLVLSPQTIGPFSSARARLAATGVLKLAKHVFARDETSRKVLDELGAGAKSSLTTDVAFALPYTPPADKDARDLASGPVKAGINVSALLYRRDIAAADKIKLTVDYPALIDAILERLARDPRIELHLVPHVLATAMPYEDDYALAETLKDRFPELILPPRFQGPSQAKSYISGLDLFMGSRMHATIAAISSNTAVVPLGYSRKFNGLFDSIGYGWNADLTSESNAAVLAKLEAALADLPRVRADAIAANAEARRRLGNYVAYLDTTIATLAAADA